MNKILITLDSLVDTRLSVLKRYYPDFLDDLEDTKEYLKRKSDNFKFIGYRNFKWMYRYRDRRDLLKAPPTNILKLIPILITLCKKSLVEHNQNDYVYIDINIYPYKLIDEEIELIRKGFESKINPNTIVGIVNSKPTEALYNKYQYIIDYSGMEFVERQLQLGGMTSFTSSLFIPAISYNPVEDKVFEGYLEMLRGVVDLNPIDISMFSLSLG